MRVTKVLVHIKTALRNIACSEHGGVLPLVGLVFLVLVTAVGLAVDYGRAQMVQSKMQASLDAAALAAATVGNNEPTEAQRLAVKTREANKYMEANFPVDYMNTLYPEGMSQYITDLRITDNGEGLSLTANGWVETAIMRVVGFDRMDVSAHTEIAIETSRFGLEVVLVLDNTGSMATVSGGETRLAALQRSAKGLVDDIYAKFDPAKTYIGIVPFSVSVKVGNAKHPSSRWKRTVSGNSPIPGDVNCIFTDSNGKTASRDVHWATRDQPPIGGQSPSALFYNSAAQDNACGNVAMSPMRNSPAAIKAAIDGMTSAGNTRIDIGAIWGWNMISPRWRGFWNHAPASAELPSALPLSYNVSGMNKVVILLTDGEIVDTPQAKVTQGYSRLNAICNRMKNNNILVYPITLHVTNMQARNAMRACATSNQHYFHVPPGASLDEVFEQIADSLANLRISR